MLVEAEGQECVCVCGFNQSTQDRTNERKGKRRQNEREREKRTVRRKRHHLRGSAGQEGWTREVSERDSRQQGENRGDMRANVTGHATHRKSSLFFVPPPPFLLFLCHCCRFSELYTHNRDTHTHILWIMALKEEEGERKIIIK